VRKLAGADGPAEAVALGPQLTTAGMTLVSTIGGAAGPLYGTLFLDMGKAAAEKTTLGASEWAGVFGAGVAGVQRRGKAEQGDKTMVDALLPAAEALRATAAAGADLQVACRAAAEAAEEGMRATTPMIARKGRASYLGERSAGHQDPGATSSWLLLETAAAVLAGVPAKGAATRDASGPGG
jgi:phosphoenolpyruvate---glycerone phosphotransferase subunit DhaL